MQSRKTYKTKTTDQSYAKFEPENKYYSYKFPIFHFP